MQYRKFGQLDWEVSALGFGAMRLPLTGDNPEDVDEPNSISMIRYAIDHGVNYVDTAYMYHSGRSEHVVGQALQDGYRDRIKLATKLPAMLVESAKDFDRFLNEQLKRLQTKKIDCYLLHGLNSHSWSKIRDLGVLSWAEGAMVDGRIDHLGFSFHDDYKVFEEIVDAYDNWAFCQVQYNYIDVDYQAGRRGIEYATGKGLAVIVMEPLRGGKLSQKPPDKVAEVWKTAPGKRDPVEWALLWIWNHPEVSMALSGMSTMAQVVENVKIADRSRPGMFTVDDLSLIYRVREAYSGSSPIPCTDCGYCIPCSSGVKIPSIFHIYNEAIIYDNPRLGRFYYRGPDGLKEEERADQCNECNECVEACPQGIPIPKWLKEAHTLLGPKQ
ncbi:aldo/keto reductase [Chloroflexota bacterium]